MAQAEAQSDLRYIRSVTAAKFSCLSSRVPHFPGGRMPFCRTTFGQDTHVQRSRVDEPDATLLGEVGQDLIHIRVHEVVVAIRKNAVDWRSLGNSPQQFWR